MIDKIAKPFWVFVERNLPLDKNKPYQIPLNYHIKVNSDTKIEGTGRSNFIDIRKI